jgi:hypothetical protein
MRVPEILETLRAIPTPWIDRDGIERAFGLRRRRSIQLLNAFGGFQVGRTFLVDRAAVIGRLEAIAAGEEFHWERRRREKLSDALTEAQRYQRASRVNIAPRPAPVSPALPAGVRLEPGRVVVEFRDVQDLLAKFYAVAQAAARDFQAFQEAVASASAPRDILRHT